MDYKNANNYISSNSPITTNNTNNQSNYNDDDPMDQPKRLLMFSAIIEITGSVCPPPFQTRDKIYQQEVLRNIFSYFKELFNQK